MIMHYGSSKKLSREGPNPTVVHTRTASVDLRRPIDFSHHTVTVVDLGILSHDGVPILPSCIHEVQLPYTYWFATPHRDSSRCRGP